MLPSKTKILILKANPQSLKAVEVFLKNRELDYFSTANLKQALAFLVQEKPQFFLIAADYPNKKVRLLPEILKKNLHCSVLGFTESSNNTSLFALQEMNPQYVLYPPISGPAIVRSIARIEKEMAKKRLAEVTEKITKLENPSDIAFIKSDYTLDLKSFQEILGDERSSGAKAESIPSAVLEQNKLVEKVSQDSLQAMTKIFQNLADELKKARPRTLKPQAIETVSNISCLVVEDGESRGYLLIAFGDNDPTDADFIEPVRKAFAEYSQSRGQDVLSPLLRLKPIQLETQPVEFLNWAKFTAELLIQTSFDKTDVAAAFMANRDIPTDFVRSEDGSMCQVELERISMDEVLDFDIFVHLPKNDKFVLYNKKGRTMFADQRQRLAARGVTHVHLKSEDIEAFYAYQAKNYINSSINDFSSESLGA